MNLVEQIFQQAQAGSAQGQGFGQFFAQGVAAGQHQQALDMQKQQLALEIAQAPLKQTLLQQDSEMNALKLESGLRNRQNLIDTETAFSGLADVVHHAMLDAEPKDVNPFFFEAIAKHPRLAETERFQTLWKDYNTSLNAKLALQEAKNTAKAGEFTPGFGVATNPLTGEKEAFWRQSPNNAPLVKPEKVDAAQSQLGKLIADRNNALTAGKAQDVATYDAEIRSRQEKMGFTIETGPDGKFKIVQGPVGATTAEKTDIAKDLNNTVDALRPLGQLRESISSTTVGPSAAVGSFVFDKMLSNLVPSLANQQRITGRSLIDIGNEELVGKLNESHRFSEAEMSRIRNLLPSKGIVSAPVEGQIKVNALARVLGEKAASDAKKLGRPVPIEAIAALSYLSNDELEADIMAGYLDGALIPQIINARKTGGK